MKKILSIIFLILGWLMVVIGFVSFFARICFHPLYEQYHIPGSIFGATMTFIIGYGLRELGYKLRKPRVEKLPTQERPVMEANQATSRLTKERKSISWKKIFASIGLAGIFGYCIGCIDEGDSLTAWMIIAYLPMFIILYVYYVRLIWKHGRKVTEEQLLLLPLLQKINILRDYSRDVRDRKRLFSTSFYGIMLSVLCTAIVSTMYYDMNHNIRDYYGICYLLLSLPIVIWVIGITKAVFQNWLSISITINKQSTNDKT